MKLKTHKATAKRIRFTKSGIMKKKKAGQDHFNARESGNTTRNKRRHVTIAQTDTRQIRQALPYH